MHSRNPKLGHWDAPSGRQGAVSVPDSAARSDVPLAGAGSPWVVPLDDP